MQVLQQFLRTYRASPHSSTGFSPNQLIGRNLSSRLPNFEDLNSTPLLSKARANQSKANKKNRDYANKRLNTKPSKLSVGDQALVKQPKTNKLSPHYSPAELVITSIKGSRVVAKDKNGKEFDRNISFFKPLLKPDEVILGTEPRLDEMTPNYGQCTSSVVPQPTSKHQGKKLSAEKKRLHRASKKDVNYRDNRAYKTKVAKQLQFDQDKPVTDQASIQSEVDVVSNQI